MLLRSAFWALALMFLGFAALQLNDPDPDLWVPLYLVPAGLMAWAANAHPPLPRWLPLVLAVVYLGLGIWWWPARFDGVTGAMNPHTTVEEGREALGLFICAICLALAALAAPRLMSGPPSSVA
jgi:hypothetical protein